MKDVASPLPLLGNVVKIFQFPAPGQNGELSKLVWLVKLRWLATALFFMMSVVGLATGYFNLSSVSKCLGLVGLLFVFNLVTYFYWTERQRYVSPLLVGFQLALDLFILTALLLITEGFENPLVSLLLLHSALGGILISGRYAWPFICLVHTLLGLLQLNLMAKNKFVIGPQMMTSFLLFHLMVLSAWLIMRSLGNYLEQQQVLRLNAQVLREKQDRLRAIGSLAAGFSHEFASPLNTARLRIARALRSSSNEDLQAAMSAIEVCEDIIRQMNSSQMDARDHQFKSVKLDELITSIAESWREANGSAPLDLQIEDVGLVKVPPINLAQVVLNLLDNAHEAAAGKTLLCLTQKDQQLVLEVHDDGAGFPVTVLERFGEPFVSTKPTGTGLGLYVSQLFAQSLGGELAITNKDPRGARVSLRWPIAEAST